MDLTSKKATHDEIIERYSERFGHDPIYHPNQRRRHSWKGDFEEGGPFVVSVHMISLETRRWLEEWYIEKPFDRLTIHRLEGPAQILYKEGEDFQYSWYMDGVGYEFEHLLEEVNDPSIKKKLLLWM